MADEETHTSATETGAPEPQPEAPGTTPAPVVALRGVTVRYGDKTVLDQLNFAIQPAEFVFLIGRTGAGKSSLLRLLYADLLPHAGEVHIAGFHTKKLTDDTLPKLRRRLGIVFQNFELLPDRTVGENLTFAMRATGWTERRKIKARITEVLVQVGLTTKVGHLPHQLSGGEQQRVAIARALINQPELLIADEPTGNLDPEVSDHVLEILHRIYQGGTPVLMATHNYELLRRFDARIVRLQDGKLHELDAPPPAPVY